MFTVNSYQSPDMVEIKKDLLGLFPVAIEVLPKRELDHLAANLSHETPWAERQIAVRKLGESGVPEALEILLQALPGDPFWIVRCIMIQALESIGDPSALPTLREVAQCDEFSAVRSAAEKAIERLS